MLLLRKKVVRKNFLDYISAQFLPKRGRRVPMKLQNEEMAALDVLLSSFSTEHVLWGEDDISILVLIQANAHQEMRMSPPFFSSLATIST
jgi:hypothetical protein